MSQITAAGALHTVIDATTGRVVLENATAGEFDRWYDHHCFWREPRAIEEVAPQLRAAYKAADDRTHYLLAD